MWTAIVKEAGMRAVSSADMDVIAQHTTSEADPKTEQLQPIVYMAHLAI